MPVFEVEDYLKECKQIEEELIEEATVNFRKLKAGGKIDTDNTFSGLMMRGGSRNENGLISMYVNARNTENGR